MYFLDFLFFKIFEFKFQNSLILDSDRPNSLAFQWISEKIKKFINPGRWSLSGEDGRFGCFIKILSRLMS
jgi:hypothetical protein